jgi:hypothetical protein
MRLAYPLTLALVLGGFLWTVTGCETEKPGASYALGSYTAMVDSTPDKVTDAAQKAVSDLQLKDIVADSTKVDGHLTARTASGDTVAIDVQQAGDNVSKVTIHVGATGDQALSRQILDKTENHLSWFSSL